MGRSKDTPRHFTLGITNVGYDLLHIVFFLPRYLARHHALKGYPAMTTQPIISIVYKKISRPIPILVESQHRGVLWFGHSHIPLTDSSRCHVNFSAGFEDFCASNLQALCHNRHAAAADETPISPPTFALCSPSNSFFQCPTMPYKYRRSWISITS